MTWTGADDAPPTARIATLEPSLQPSERRVVEVVLTDIAGAVELTAQELADQAGTGRATVVRTAQSLGYAGYPQLRVALALEVATHERRGRHAEGTVFASLIGNVERFGDRLSHITSALNESDVEDFVNRLDVADRVLVVANGLSVPLSLDLVLRLNSIGRPAEYLPDAQAQQIAASQLSSTSVCLVVSGSGANSATLGVMRAAREAGAQLLSLTSFAGSPVERNSDIGLVVPPMEGSFHGELVHTSRVSLALIAESLIDALAFHRGERGASAQAAVFGSISRSITE